MSYKTIKKLFLLDGLGALLSAFLLGIVLVKFEWFFGIPKHTLYILASLPCLFALYDFYCYYKLDKNLAQFLKLIATVNLLYCFLSIALAFNHVESLTVYGWIYILLEIIIVICLAFYELSVARKNV